MIYLRKLKNYMNKSKGIILAGGRATRLNPVTQVISKQLLPVYDKPMVYYPLALLMLAGIREIAIIVNPKDKISFQNLLGHGEDLGIQISYIVQSEPKGIPEAYILAEDFLSESTSFLILGDNIFVGPGLGRSLSRLDGLVGAHIFLYQVDTPSQYGNVELDRLGKIIKIVEKPINPKSNFAIPGLYVCDSSAPLRAKELKPSKREELEVTDLLSSFLNDKLLNHTELVRGTAWLDTGTPNSLYAAAEYVRVIQERQGVKIACLEEISLKNGWLTANDIRNSSPII